MITAQFIRSFLFKRMNVTLLILVLCDQPNFSQSHLVHSYSVGDITASNLFYVARQDFINSTSFTNDQSASNYDRCYDINFPTNISSRFTSSFGIKRNRYYNIRVDINRYAEYFWDNKKEIGYLVPISKSIYKNSELYMQFDFIGSKIRLIAFEDIANRIYIYTELKCLYKLSLAESLKSKSTDNQ